MSDTLIKVDNLVKNFKSGDSYINVLKGLNFDIKKGEIFSILGPSGSGKSTLLHILGLLDKPTSGKVFYNGRDFSTLSIAESTSLRNTTFGFIFQFYHLIPELSVLENTLLPFMIRHSYFSWLIHKHNLRTKALSLLDKVGLSHRIHHRVNHLSGGESQRVAIARALITEPEVIFCDEPTGNLDQATSREIQDIIWAMNKNSGQTFVIVTHDENIASKANRIVRLVDGNINLR
jgi:lipoprotein-releasing system ATP-binding protein